eukprot:scaffold33702_cov112-Isochrysis_galbana.AAC.7
MASAVAAATVEAAMAKAVKEVEGAGLMVSSRPSAPPRSSRPPRPPAKRTRRTPFRPTSLSSRSAQTGWRAR